MTDVLSAIWAQTDLLSDPDVLARGGLVGVLATALFGAIKEWWVPGVTYRRALKEAEQWRQLALEGGTLAKEAVEVLSSETHR